MNLIVGDLFTEIRGSYFDYALIGGFLTVNEGTENQRTLLYGNRFYSGLIDVVSAFLRSNNVYFFVEDNRQYKAGQYKANIPADYLKGISLRGYQIDAIKKSIYFGRGIIDLPTRGGKTEIAAGIFRFGLENIENFKAVFMVDTTNSVEQTYLRFKERGIDSVGRLGGGNREFDCKVLVACVDSVYSALKRGNNDFIQWAMDVYCLIWNETHHLPASTWVRIGETFLSPWRFGMSASPFERHDSIVTERDYKLIGLTGKIIHKMTPKYLIGKGWLAEPYITMTDIDYPKFWDRDWNNIYRICLEQNRYRNNIAISLAKQLHKMGMKILILVHKIEHGKVLARQLTMDGYYSIFAYGGGNVFDGDTQEIEKRQFVEIKKWFDAHRILIGSSVFNEDIDFPDLNCVIIISGYKKFRLVIQRAGRALTAPPGSPNKVFIFDFNDTMNPILKRHSAERREVYETQYECIVRNNLEEVNKYLPSPIVLDYLKCRHQIQNVGLPSK